MITAAFAVAATELNFAFDPLFTVCLKDGSIIQSLGLIGKFGSDIGTLIFAENRHPKSHELAELRSMGYYNSILFANYASFDCQYFKDTLDDWGFFGHEADCPDWYRGKFRQR